MAELQDVLPPGWDCKYDPKTGRHYFINHYTKISTWEDPRYRYRQLHGTPVHHSNMAIEHIPLQHGSPDLRRNHVYPQNQNCPQPAFQMSSHYSPKNIPLQDLSRGSPLSVRAARVQDTSLSAPPDPEQSVSKISAMFPTVSDTHIRLLLKKYHGREAVVISALQVEKHPITTPGPFTTPPPLRNLHTPFQMTPPLGLKHSSRGGSPILRPGSASPLIGGEGAYHRPHSSPKMKLRYMKSLFPQAEETVILDILGNNDNNINNASEALKTMGYEKKSKPAPTPKPETPKKEETPPQHTPPLRKLKSLQEKKQVKQKLHHKYKDIEEHVISLALESSDFDEERAIQILDFMVQEQEEENKKNSEAKDVEKNNEDEMDNAASTDLKVISVVPSSQSRQSLKVEIIENNKCRRSKEKKHSNRINEATNNGPVSEYKSSYISKPSGPNSAIVQGSNDNLLLEDYITWHGANPTICKGSKGLAKGPNRSLLIPRSYQAHGPNSELKKGPVCGLAKGSIFSQLKSVVVGESRGK